MVRPLMFLSILVAGSLAATAALADIDLIYSYGQLSAYTEGFPSQNDVYDGPGTWSAELSSGDASSVRAYQSATVTNADGHLRTTGNCGVDISVVDGVDLLMLGTSQIEITFAPSKAANYVLRGTLSAEATVILSGIPDSADISVSGPGDFDLSGALVAGPVYTLLFGVHATVGEGHDLPGDNLGTLEFTLDEEGAVPDEDIAWGDLHNAFR